MHDTFAKIGLEVIAFPSNDFDQEPRTNAEIKKWVKEQYNLKFKIMAKTHVNGPHTGSVFRWLRTNSRLYHPETNMSDLIGWNFFKFLIDGRTGKIVKILNNKQDPYQLVPEIRKLLGEYE